MSIFQGSQDHNSDKELVKFKAGRMKLQDGVVRAEKAKGFLCLTLQDGASVLQWKDRLTNKVVKDWILFPGTAEFKRVEKVKDGKVFVLELKNPSGYHFFWMQDKNDENEDEYVKEINSYIENPNSEFQNSAFSALQNLESGSQQATQRPPQQSRLQESQLNDILKTLGVSVPQQSQQQQVSLNQVLKNEDIEAILKENPEICQKLAEHLPDGTGTDPRSIVQHIRSPQFRNLVNVFNGALSSGELSGLMKSLDLPTDIYTVNDFLTALNNKYGKKS